MGVLTFPHEIRAEVRRRKVGRANLTEKVAPLDVHGDLTRCKLAALLALLEGRHEVWMADWELAGQVWDTSCQVRDLLIKHGQAQAKEKSEVRIKAHVEREVRTKRALDDDQLQRIAAYLAKRVHKRGTMTRGYAKKELRSQDKPRFDEALEHAIGQGWLAEDDGKVSPGSSKPAGT